MKHFALKILLLLLIIPVLRPAYAQSNVREAQYVKGPKELIRYLSTKFFNTIRDNYADTCLEAACFVKFSIDSTGTVKDIVFSTHLSVSQGIKDALVKTIQSTNGDWIPSSINGHPTNSRPFLLPITFDFEIRCTMGRLPNTTYSDLRYMLEFEDGSKPYQLDCILLQPLHFFKAI